MSRLKKGQCKIVADVYVYTVMPNGSRKREHLEKRIEDLLQSCYVGYLNMLAGKLKGPKQVLVEVEPHTYELRKEKV